MKLEALPLTTQVHGHDDMQEVVLASRAEDTGGGFNVRFEDHVGCFDHVQDLTQEAHVEGDEQGVALDIGVDHGLVETGLLGLPGDLNRPGLVIGAGGDLDTGDVGAFTGEDLGLLAGFEDGGGGDDRAGLVGAGDDLLEIRVGAFDEL